MNFRLFAWPPHNTADAPVSPAGSLPVAPGESAGATVSAAVAPAAPAVEAPAAPAVVPAATPVVEAKAPATEAEAAPAVSKEFKPSLLEVPAGESPEPVVPVVEAKPGDKPAEATKTDAPAEKTPEPVVESAKLEPLVYEFRFPEKLDSALIDKPALEKYTSALNKARVPLEVAQEALDLHFEQARTIEKRLSDTQWEVFNRQQEAWQSRAMSDPEVGGTRFKTAQRAAARFIEGMGFSPAEQKEFMDTMRTTGAGNNPVVYKYMVRAGERFFKEGEARNMPPARQVPLTREQKQAARYK